MLPLVEFSNDLPIRNRYCFSEHRIDSLKRDWGWDIVQSNKSYKPDGMWYSWGGVWICMLWKHTEKWGGKWRINRIKRYKFVYKLTLDRTKILNIYYPADFLKFNEEYDSKSGIKWGRVARDYGGIDIRYREKLEDKYEWYDGWDVSSGCIWNPDVIKSFKQVWEI